MGKLCRITDGDTIINFITEEDWQLERGGVSQSPLTDAHLVGDDPVAGKTMVISYKLATTGADHDELKTKVSALIALIRKAAQYHRTDWQLSPVWIEEQGRTESNPRYATVLRAMELDKMSVLLKPFDLIHYLVNVGLTFELEFPWRPERPAALPTALTLTATQQDADGLKMEFANFRDDETITTVFVEDFPGSYGGNIYNVANQALFPNIPAAGDGIFFGSIDGAPKNVCVDITVIGVFDHDLQVRYYNGSWTNMVHGTDFTILAESGGPVTSEDDLFTRVGRWYININPPSDMVAVAVNGVAAYWIHVRVNAVTSTTVVPKKNANDIITHRSNYFEIASAQLIGDHPIRTLIRLRVPSGGGASPGFSTPSRFILGSRSHSLGANEFEPWLNAGNQDNPSGWAVTYGADTSATATIYGFGAYIAKTTFSGESSMVARTKFTGTSKLQYYRGKFEVFILYFQIGGAAGDINMMARFSIGSLSTTSPQRLTKQVASELGAIWTVASLGEMGLPFGEITSVDELDEDLFIEIMAERITGAALLDVAAVFLCPIDEWSGGLDDPLTDTVTGPSALRGDTALDFDNGVLARRAQKFLVQSDGDLIPAENWHYSGSLPSIEPNRQTRIYVLQLHYNSDWGVGPMVARGGMLMSAEVFAQPGYVLLRGDD